MAALERNRRPVRAASRRGWAGGISSGQEPMSETELSVVCKSCGAEVSPYVTECPYCGARVRKRAPDLERRDGGLEAKRSRRERRRQRKRKGRAAQRERSSGLGRAVGLAAVGQRPWATLALIAVPAAAMLARIAAGDQPAGFGALTVPFEDEWWRLLTAPFVYGSVGYLFVVGLVLAIFGPGIERRLGSVATVLLLVACGALGALAALGIENARGVLTMITGGNGIALGAIAAWFFTARTEARAVGESVDVIGVAVSAAVVLLLPAVVDWANPWAGIVGGLVGSLAGIAAARAGR